MAARIVLDGLALRDEGPTLTLTVGPGQSLCVLGPAGAGKSLLMETLAGDRNAERGKAQIDGTVAFASSAGSNRRQKPQALIPRGGQGGGASAKATEVLGATGLWDVRARSLAELSPSQLAACALLEPLSSGADVLLLDGDLDRIDPWALRGVLDLLDQRLAEGAALVATTHRPDLAARFDTLVVLADRQVRFAGTPDELVRQGPPYRMTVKCLEQPGVRALVEPFEVSVIVTEDGAIELTAKEGQHLAQRLLLEGYGNVETVLLRPPTLEEALLRLLTTSPAR
jgi:ABC-type multidrug transport system ATPase subunit